MLKLLYNFEILLRDLVIESYSIYHRDFNSLSYRQKMDYGIALSNFEPIKSCLIYKAEIYFNLLNHNYGHLQIEITVTKQGLSGLRQDILTINNPKPLYIPFIRIAKVKVIMSPGAEHIAKGLNLLKKYLVKGPEWDLGNLFELPVNKKLLIRHMSWPTGPIKGPFVRMIQKDAPKDQDTRIRDNISVTMTILEPDAQDVWESMVSADSLTLGSKVVLKDYIKPFFDVTKFEKFTY